MPSKRRWIGRRQPTDAGGEPAEEAPPDIPPPPATTEPIPPPPPIPQFEPAAAGDDAEADRSPLAQGRYERLTAAAGIDPHQDLSPHALSVLDWLSRQDDAICSGIVELLQATSLATARHLENANGP